ncbi:hypothetical protein H8356DRAFT_1329125 [Neocallimastix lanati (nom. inval.)]|nr:hypothetical protein H8356DRAFT_1329125 [Neocallimastix sp. JGI-2020a]
MKILSFKNRASNRSLKRFRLSLDFLLYHLDAKMKNIPYVPLYTTGFFSMIS